MRNFIAVLASGTALVLGVAACGGSSTPAGTTSTSEVPTTSTVGPGSTSPGTTAVPGSATTPESVTTSGSATKPGSVTTVAAAAGLSAVVLSATEVTQLSATLVTQQVAPDGTSLSDATLDVCASRFPSERLRIARDQVIYLDGNGAVSAGNEIVRYSAAGATESYAELRAAVALPCTPPSGVSDLRAAPADPHLATEQVILTAQISGSGGATSFIAGVYQYKGDLLSAVYSYRPTQASALQSAEAIAVGADAKLTAAAA